MLVEIQFSNNINILWCFAGGPWRLAKGRKYWTAMFGRLLLMQHQNRFHYCNNIFSIDCSKIKMLITQIKSSQDEYVDHSLPYYSEACTSNDWTPSNGKKYQVKWRRTMSRNLRKYIFGHKCSDPTKYTMKPHLEYFFVKDVACYSPAKGKPKQYSSATSLSIFMTIFWLLEKALANVVVCIVRIWGRKPAIPSTTPSARI